MGAEKFDLVGKHAIEIGADYRKRLVVTDSNDDPIDLTGYSGLMQVRKDEKESSPVLIDFTSDDGSMLFDANGNLDLLRLADVTSLLKCGTALYDIFIVSPTNQTRKLLYGSIDFTGRVTRP